MIDVVNEVKVYEKRGRDTPLVGDEPPLTVRSHWNRNEFVRLVIADVDITVNAADLQAAINNATNTGRR